MIRPATTLSILPLGTITRVRTLPFPGRVLVREGQRVSPADIIAETSISRKHFVFDLADKLQQPAEKVDGFLRVKRGQKISKGELLAETSGIFGREVTSPINGRIAAIGGGKLVIETARSGIEVRSGLEGLVIEVIENRGAVIRASGALVQGVWGNGKSDSGVLLSLISKPDDVLEASQLDVSLRGSVILAGHVADAGTLKSAADLPVRGLVLSSMSPTLVSVARQAPYPILLLDGFGRRAMNETAYKLLSTNIKRDVSVNAEVPNKRMGIVPELFLTLPFSQEPADAPVFENFEVGQTVKVISLIYPGRVGKIVQLPDDLLLLPNGVRARSAKVQLDADEIIVPLSNLEVLG